MTIEIDAKIKKLDEQIKQLEQNKKKIYAEAILSWPKEIVVYVHSSSENVRALGEDLGLSEEALGVFKYCACEVALRVSVNKNGTCEILGIKE